MSLVGTFKIPLSSKSISLDRHNILLIGGGGGEQKKNKVYQINIKNPPHVKRIGYMIPTRY